MEPSVDAQTYYGWTGESFRALCPKGSDLMNIGIWPPERTTSEGPNPGSLKDAQEALVRRTLERAKELVDDETLRTVVDGGSGWGGARPVFLDVWPHAQYVGINASAAQVEHARARHRQTPRTRYVLGRIEDEATWTEVGPADAFVSVEAAFHFENKEDLFQRLSRRGIRALSLAEIVVRDRAIVEAHPLLRPSLFHAWSSARYEDVLSRLGARDVEVLPSEANLFAAFAEHLHALDVRGFRARGGRVGILSQLKAAFAELSRLADRELVSYVFVRARLGES